MLLIINSSCTVEMKLDLPARLASPIYIIREKEREEQKWKEDKNENEHNQRVTSSLTHTLILLLKIR